MMPVNFFVFVVVVIVAVAVAFVSCPVFSSFFQMPTVRQRPGQKTVMRLKFKKSVNGKR